MGTKTSVSCGEQLNIQHVEGLKDRLIKALDKEPEYCTLNVSKVEKVDSAGLQLLYAFLKESDKRKINIHWQNPSEAFLTSVALLGLSEELKLQD
ncbi:STAS domain-containing protein [Pleionea sediminis]|uniref:STAS domain-containing protein n=1 Tax=Pleionea sediminis TaxID=2569479 RepID=UPI0011853DD4|nr:STAS domain-containing protein [Pleionea sediminis]